MNNASLTLLDRLICYFATLGGDEKQMADLLGQLKQLLLELSNGPAALPGARGQNPAEAEEDDYDWEFRYTRLCGRGLALPQAWKWLDHPPTILPAPSPEVTPRARGQPGRSSPLRDAAPPPPARHAGAVRQLAR